MLKITDFETVLEMAFGLNALFYIFELIPHTEDRLKELSERQKELYDRKVKATHSTEVFPIGLVLGSRYSSPKRILKKLSVIASLLSFGILLYSAFHPNAEIWLQSIWTLLVFVYGVPVSALWVHGNAIRWVKASNMVLQKQIQEAERNGAKCTLQIDKQQIIIDPGPDAIRTAVSQLTTNPNVTFLKLCRDNEDTLIRISGRRKTGFTIAFQEKDSSCAYKSEQCLPKDETIETLLDFLDGNNEWKDLADWREIERIPETDRSGVGRFIISTERTERH